MGGEIAWGMVKHRFLGSGECFGQLVRDLKGMKLEEKSGGKTCEWTPRDKEKVYRSLCLSLMSNREHSLQKRLSTVRWVDRFTHPMLSASLLLSHCSGRQAVWKQWSRWQERGLCMGPPAPSLNIKRLICKQWPWYSTIPQGHHPDMWCQVDYTTSF